MLFIFVNLHSIVVFKKQTNSVTKIQLPNRRIAQIVFDVLQVDKEYRKSDTARTMNIDDEATLVV